MTNEIKFVLISLAILIPITTILLQELFYAIGKYIWEHFLLKKLKRTSKLRIKFLKLRRADLVYVITGTIFSSLLFSITVILVS